MLHQNLWNVGHSRGKACSKGLSRAVLTLQLHALYVCLPRQDPRGFTCLNICFGIRLTALSGISQDRSVDRTAVVFAVAAGDYLHQMCTLQ